MLEFAPLEDVPISTVETSSDIAVCKDWLIRCGRLEEAIDQVDGDLSIGKTENGTRSVVRGGDRRWVGGVTGGELLAVVRC